MGTDKDENNILNDQELTSNSSASVKASRIFDSAADGDLDDLKKLIATAFSSEIRLGIEDANLSFPPAPCLNLLRDKKNSTPLHYAAGNGHVEVCRFLLQTVSNESRNNLQRSNTLLSSGETAASSYANAPNKTQGRTALHWAARNGHLEVCKLLVEEYGANPDPLAKGDVTPLQLAVWRAHLDVCLWLSENGCADKHFMNGWGCTVHHWLAKSPIYAEALQQIKSQNNDHVKTYTHRDREIDPTKHAKRKLLALCKWLDDEPKDGSSSKLSAWNRPNDHGQTPLHKAGFGGNMPVLKFLIETKKCCDVYRDSQHNTAADCAERNRQWEAAKYLRRHGNPRCLQNASTILFPKCKEPPRMPSLTSIRAAYIKLARLYHPDRSIESRSINQDATIHNIATPMSRWKALQDAYRLWTLWWKDPDEADSLIRGLERHFYLQRQLPLLLLWHEQWHDNRESNENTESGGQKFVSKIAKKQKVDSHNENFGHRPPSKQQFSDEALQRLEDFERKLVRLLSTLPSQEIPLSQLPKEYEKTWGGTNSDGQTAMIRPRTYRCKKLRFLLEKHCSRTIEVVPKFRAEGETAATILMVRLCNVK